MSCSMTAEYIVSILVMTISVVEVHRTDYHALSNEYMIIIVIYIYYQCMFGSVRGKFQSNMIAITQHKSICLSHLEC